MDTFRKLYMNDYVEDRMSREVYDHIQRLREMDISIERYVTETKDEGYEIDEMWTDLQREVRVSMERLAAVSNRDPNGENGLYRTLRKCEENLRKEAQFEAHGYRRYYRHRDLGVLACILEISPLTSRYAKEIVEHAYDGGKMIFAKAMSVYEEIQVRNRLHRCISVTVQGAQGGIQNAMAKHNAIGASLVGVDFKVYFDKADEEQAVLFKCSA